MPVSGRALADAYIRVRADMSSVGPDVARGLDGAVTTGSRSAGRRMKDAIAAPIKEGFAEGVRAADPGGAAVGGRFRQGVIGKLRGMAADTQRAGVDAGTGLDRGISTKMRDVAATTTRGGQAAGAGFARGIGGRARDAILAPLREGFAEGVRSADPGGQAVGGRFRQALIGRLRGVAADTQRAGVDAGTGIDRGIASKMRDVAATTGKGGREAGASFGREAGRATEREGGYLSRAGHSAGESLVSAFAAVEVGTAVVDFFKDSVAAASDLGEAANKLQVLFGSAAPQVQTWAAGAATSLGLSKLAAEDAAATFGVFAQSAGLAGTQSAQFSEKMVGLAGDLASFHNTSPEQAIEAIGAALRGESEPIRAYGILLDDATLRQRAMKLGITDTTKNALTPQQRVLAAQAEILAQTGAAQGDFARTSGGLANQQRIMAAQIENAKAALGVGLLPVVQRVVTFLNTVGIPAFVGVVHGLSAIPGPVYAAAAGIAALYAAFRVGSAVANSKTFTDIGKALQWMGLRSVEAAAEEGVQAAAARGQAAANDTATASTTRLGSAMGALAKGGAIVGLAAIATQITQWASSATVAKAPTDALTQSMTQLGRTGQITGAGLDVFKQGWGPFSQDVHNSGEAMARFGDLAKGALGGANESFTEMIGRQIDGASRMGQLTGITQQYDAALTSMVQGGSVSEARAAFAALAKSATDQGVDISQINALFPSYTAAVAAAGAASQGAAAGVAATGAATKGASAAAAQATVTLGSLTAQYPKYKDQIMAAVGAQAAASGAATVLTSAQVTAARAAATQAAAEDHLKDSLNASNNATLARRGGEAAYYAALDATRAALRTNGATMDIHTAKGRANRAALDDLASSGLAYLGVIQKNNGIGPVFRSTLDQQWQKLYQAARRFGATREEARRYAGQILAVPKALATKVSQPGMAAAQKAARDLKHYLESIRSVSATVHVNADGNFVRTFTTASGGIRSTVMKAEGGEIPMVRGARRGADSVPAMLTPDEHVWTTREVRGAGGHGNVKRLRSLAARGALPKLATGGAVGEDGVQRYAAGGTVNRNLTIRARGALPGPDFRERIDNALSIVGAYIGKGNQALAENVGGGPGMTWQQEIAILRAVFPHIRLISAFRPGAKTVSGSTSYHALGRAVDVTPSMAIFNWIASHYPGSRELIYSPAGGRQIHNGAHHMYTGAVRAMHFNHVHWAYGAGGGGGPSTGAGGGYAANRALGRSMAAARGWTGGQWNALERLWQGESGWNNRARNPSSGAYGIPQALPASKMGAAGAAGNARAQIAWGLGYIKSRYGTPANAYSRWLSRSPHWYAAGTRYADPGWAVLGEHGPELARLGRGGEVKTATETRSIERRAADGADLVRLHPDTVAQLAGVLAGALSRQPITLDGRTLAGYVDRSMGTFSLSGRG